MWTADGGLGSIGNLGGLDFAVHTNLGAPFGGRIETVQLSVLPIAGSKSWLSIAQMGSTGAIDEQRALAPMGTIRSLASCP
jgi:hypothetical protein